MKIMVIERTVVDSAALSTSLREGGHTPVAASDANGASSAAGASAPHLCVLGTVGGEDLLVDLVKKLRTVNTKLVVCLLAKDPTEAFLTKLYDAGLDFDVRLPASTPFLLTRLNVVERQLQLPTTRVAAPAKVVAGGAPVKQTGDALTSFVMSNAWRSGPRNIEIAANKFLTLPTVTAEVTTVTAPLTHGKQIMLASAEHQIEIRAAVGADIASARALAMHLFGSDEDELAIDMLGEVANIFMGTLKSAFSADALAVTGGLPTDLNPELILRPNVTFKHQESFALVIDSARLVVHLGMRSKANVFVAPTSLGEGMVLAKDLHNLRGMLLLSAGTRLSASMIEKIRGAIAPKGMVEVAP